MSGLYIHIPFCVRKCSYCTFYSVAAPGHEIQSRFFAALWNELQTLPPDFSPKTIFIGGGTPAAVEFDLLRDFLAGLKRFHPVEFSCEVNPCTVNTAKLELLRNSGVNRISIGVQSFSAGNLKLLGRIHSAAEAAAAVRMARAAGFQNISIDLMFGIPAQTIKLLDSDLDRALTLSPDHISIYNLIYEPDTPLTAKNPERLGEDLEAEMYQHIRQRLTGEGFLHYEISNFAKPGFECRHNLLYWNGGEYIGCGPAAHSHWNNIRYANISDLNDYCTSGARREFEEKLTPENKARETFVMSLRQISGAGIPPELIEPLAPALQKLESTGLIEISGDHVRLTESALFISNSVFAELI